MRRRFARRAGRIMLAVILALLIAAASLSWLLTTLFGEGWTFVFVIIGWAIAIGLVGRVIVRTIRAMVAPMGDLIEASGRIEAGEVGTQVEVRGSGEMRSMARAFNAMSARLATDTEERRRLLADVSHELRTPLTVIQGNIEGMLDGLYPADRPHLERLLAETRQLERLVEDLRTLSLADAGALPLHREPTELSALATDVVAGFGPQAAADGVELTVEGGEAGTLDLDPRRVRQVIGNLVTNALRHTPPGGRVSVAVNAGGDGVELVVSDTGSGMDAEAVERAFDRFWRSGDAAGAGLGLGIVRDLVRAHGGDVTLESSPGTGTTVRCRFIRSPG
jgi:signal transduction histidine kinase